MATEADALVVGFGLPFVAVAWPVWRAVRVDPVEAIRVGHLATRSGRAALMRLPLPGRGWRHVPIRNLLRTPRRSALTALGIAAAITTLITTVGFLDTFNATLDKSQTELLRTAPNRINVAPTQPEPQSGQVVSAIRALPQRTTCTPASATRSPSNTHKPARPARYEPSPRPSASPGCTPTRCGCSPTSTPPPHAGTA